MNNYTEEQLNEIISWISSGRPNNHVPEFCKSRAAVYRFLKRFSSPEYQVRDRNLFYSGLQVVPLEKKEVIMKDIFKDPEKQVLGRDRFYYTHIRYVYANISQLDVMNFLKRNELYQLHKPVVQTRVSHSINTTKLSSLWMMDTVIMRSAPRTDKPEYELNPKGSLQWYNDGYGYILTIIDSFSKRAWIYPLKKNNTDWVNWKLRGLLDSIAKKDIRYLPKVIQTDNGVEFSRLGQVLNSYDPKIRHITTAPYTPQQNSIIERFNKTVKQMIYQLFTSEPIKTKGKIWYKYASELESRYNETWHSTIKCRPMDLWSNFDVNKIRQTRANIQKHINKTKAQIKKVLPPINKGDYVRIALVKDDVEHRKAELSGIGYKSYKINWSREIYQVNSAHQNNVFTLLDLNGNKLTSRYYRWMLQKVTSPINMLK